MSEGIDHQHLAILSALAMGQKLPLASRHQDKLRRKLRALGLIAYCGKPVRWQISEAGLSVREHMLKEPSQ